MSKKISKKNIERNVEEVLQKAKEDFNYKVKMEKHISAVTAGKEEATAEGMIYIIKKDIDRLRGTSNDLTVFCNAIIGVLITKGIIREKEFDKYLLKSEIQLIKEAAEPNS